jgi:NAD-dependent SIR2 family protein deacetylase
MSGIEKIKSVLENAEALVVGAGAGLSTSAGFTYSGERFEQYFSDFRARYGFSDMYTGGFYPYKTLEEHWAYWSRYIMINRYMDAPIPVYEGLFDLVKNKNYFVITTNVDHCFQKAGFDKSRLFYTQGDYGLFQCSEPCHKKTYDNEEQIRAMYEAEQDMKIPTGLLPKCPVCGKPVSMNLRADDTFVEDEGWHRAALRYQDFLNGNKNKNIVYLELGVGGNTPGIIKYPFWNMTYSNPKAKYICINKGEAVVPKEIENQSICVDNDIWAVLRELVPQEKRKQ